MIASALGVFDSRSGSKIVRNQVQRDEVSQSLLDAATSGNEIAVNSLLSGGALSKKTKGEALIEATKNMKVSVVERLLKEDLLIEDIANAHEEASYKALYSQEMRDIVSHIIKHQSATRASFPGGVQGMQVQLLTPDDDSASSMKVDKAMHNPKNQKKCTLF